MSDRSGQVFMVALRSATVDMFCYSGLPRVRQCACAFLQTRHSTHRQTTRFTARDVG